jgi:hypothetical protein
MYYTEIARQSDVLIEIKNRLSGIEKEILVNEIDIEFDKQALELWKIERYLQDKIDELEELL